MSSITLTLGARQMDRILLNADDLLRWYRRDTGCLYIEYRSLTPLDQVVPEDLAITLLVNSHVGWRAFQSLIEFGKTIDLTRLPQKPLEQTTPQDREQIAAFIAEMAQLPGFTASVATKLLHKKRPALIPNLDNQAIFGAYLNPHWPERPASTESIKNKQLIKKALNWIAFDLNRLENAGVWDKLLEVELTRSRVQLFDSIWWMYFRSIQRSLRKGT